MTETLHELTCLEVWSGNRLSDHVVELPGLRAWVHSAPIDAAAPGGDLHYLSACAHGELARVLLADVSGHGADVAPVSKELLRLMREHINDWDQSNLVRELNSAFRRVAPAGKYATAVLLGYWRTPGQLAFTNAGHHPPLWFHAATGEWTWVAEDVPAAGLCDLPVGLIPGTCYRQTVLNLDPGDLLLLYTDGIIESEAAPDRDLGRDGLATWAREAPHRTAEALGRAILSKLSDWRREPNDDETVIVVERC